MTASITSWREAEWFCQKLEGAGLDRPHAHGNIAMAGDEDDWYRDARLCQLRLKVEAAQAWELDIENQAGRNVRGTLAGHKVGRRAEGLGQGKTSGEKRLYPAMESRTRGSSSITKTMQGGPLTCVPPVSD